MQVKPAAEGAEFPDAKETIYTAFNGDFNNWKFNKVLLLCNTQTDQGIVIWYEWERVFTAPEVKKMRLPLSRPVQLVEKKAPKKVASA